MTIVLAKEVCQQITVSLEREWLATNGIGGYASSTIAGANTRRYHGLLMAATRPPLGRTLLLSKLEEFFCIRGREIPLSTNIYPNTIYPEGYKNLARFCLNPFPTFDYLVNGIRIKKTIFMVHGENTTVILYQVQDREEQTHASVLKVRAMIAFRDYHCVTHENPHLKTDYKVLANGISIQPYDTLPPLYLFHNAHTTDNTSFWYKNMEYPKEMERGLEAHEDHFSPFALHFDLNKGSDFFIVASTKAHDSVDVFELFRREISRRKNTGGVKHLNNQTNPLISPPSQGLDEGEETKLTELVESLSAVSDSFIVQREGDKKSIIAGYHWFGDWGRDTMISLSGLTLVHDRFEDARKILLSYAEYADKGMIPNRFPDYGEQPEYNTVDASLWYIHAVYQYVQYTKDLKTIRKDLYGVLQEIVDYYEKGTRYNIHMDTDGLISAGAEGVQLTWMDAKVGDWVVTPRRGKAVEINALWYNALKILSFLAHEMNLPEESARHDTFAEKAATSFRNVFWYDVGQYLYDYIDGGTRNTAIRPNQIFAVSLPYSMLSLAQQRRVVEVVKEHLLTPFGLRSLSPKDRDYLGRYCGNPYERDRAYHQGTVWAWLIGPYISAYARAYAGEEGTATYIKRLFLPFHAHLFDAGLGTISEIFDGDYPHIARGCISQAWSVGEILRAYFEHAHEFKEK
ncbi:Amylo-alpha-1,6-glucosidase [Candidatus Brocadiaceae bacterium B188]|nr:glycogen debranching enzyme family protein [Candidatus Brocadia sapporoensis]QQR66613.1 MAG: glycogen debranching enzyme family protein [Candidatus Brocadia sp.]RZV59418.1 MAG: glycogen debranching protein [Candidatus Brocadia sp. BROELEC01]TWU53576.1 Amylo-alpha-1,6-glucosidase [Candidatus Brocadiaceae bacterium B188]